MIGGHGLNVPSRLSSRCDSKFPFSHLVQYLAALSVLVMAGCSAKNCRNRNDKGLKKVRCFRFPSNKKRKKLWADACGRGDWSPNSYSRLCAVHFEDSQFEQQRQDGWKKLKPNAVPTLFVGSTTSTLLPNKTYASHPGDENNNESYTFEYERKFDPHTYSQGKLEHIVVDGSKETELADTVEHLPEAGKQGEMKNQCSTCPVVVKLRNVEDDDDEFDIIGKNYALKLKRLPRDQRIHAEKLIGDIFYEAALGNLSRETVVTRRTENQILFQFPPMYSLPVTPYVTQNETIKSDL